MVNREYSLRSKIESRFGRISMESVIDNIIDFIDEKHENVNAPPKFCVSREKSIRYPEFSLNIFVNGSDDSFSTDNIKETLDKPSSNDFLKNSVYLGDSGTSSQTLIVINLDSDSYKSLFTLYDESTPHSTRVKIYDDTKLILPNDKYNLWYKIELGCSAGTVGEVLRRKLEERDKSYVYELKDERDKVKDEVLEKMYF